MIYSPPRVVLGIVLGTITSIILRFIGIGDFLAGWGACMAFFVPIDDRTGVWRSFCEWLGDLPAPQWLIDAVGEDNVRKEKHAASPPPVQIFTVTAEAAPTNLVFGEKKDGPAKPRKKSPKKK